MPSNRSGNYRVIALAGYKLTRGYPLASFAVVQFLLLVAFLYPYLSGRLYFVYRDITSYFEPFARYFAASLAEGRFPIWNPLVYTGMPQVAVGHPHILYPFTWLLATPSFSQALAVYLLVHLFIAGVCAFQLARRLGYRYGTAVVCGFALTWNGYMLGMFSNFQLMAAVTWIPALLLACESVEGLFSPRNVARVAGVFAAVYLLIGAGSPEVSVPAFGLVLLWVAVRSWQLGRDGVWVRRLLLRLAGLGGGLLVAAPIILPAVEWIPYSTRRHGLPDWMVLAWSTDWLNWISILCTHPLGGEGDALRLFFRITRGDDGHSYYLDSPYLSPVVIVLAIWGAFAKGWRGKVVLLAVLAVMVILASGANTPLGPLFLHWFPVLRIVRYPVKLVIFVMGGLMLLAANGLDALFRREMSRWAAAATVLLGGGCLAAGYVLSLNYERVWPWMRPSFSNGEAFPVKLIVYVNGLLAMHFYFAGLLVIGYLLIALLQIKRRIAFRTFALWSVGLVAVPLLFSAFVFERHGSSEAPFTFPNLIDQYSAAPGSGFDRSQQRYLVPRSYDSFVIPVDVWQTLGSAVGAGMRYASALGMYNTTIAYGIAGAHGFEGAAISDYFVLLHEAANRSGILTSAAPAAPRNDRALARFAALTASKVVLESEAVKGKAPVLEGSLFRVVRHDEGLQARLYETVQIRPRWYLSHDVECLATPDAFLNRLVDAQPQAMDGDSRASYVVRREIGFGADAICGLHGLGGNPGDDRVELHFDRKEDLEWKVRSDRDSLLVVADQFYTGWEATVDGKPAPIVRTNLINRGVWLPRGDHIVRMTYRPKSLQFGLRIAGATLGVLLLAVVCSWGLQFRGRRQVS